MDESLLIHLARKAIETRLDKNIKLDKNSFLENYSYLNEKKAVFVTLNLNEQLRGCIGTLFAYRMLYEDIVYNSQAAAFEDPRFNPISKIEFDNINLELSILSTPKDIIYLDFQDLENKLIHKPGVILELDGKKATFLPQVWEQLNSFNDFMLHLCKKAGLNPSKLTKYPNIKTYDVKKIKE